MMLVPVFFHNARPHYHHHLLSEVKSEKHRITNIESFLSEACVHHIYQM